MRKTKAVLCLLIALMLMTFTACSGGTASYKLKNPDFEGSITEKSKSKALFTEKNKKEDLLRISKTDLLSLYFDKKNYSVSVYDTNAKKLWNSLPEKYTDGSPAVLSVEVYVEAKKFTLNSQTDSVEKGLASYKKEKNGVTVTYKFQSEIDGKAKVDFAVPVKYSIENSTMTVSVDAAEILNNESSKNVTISSIKLLEFFGSSTKGEKGDFIFVPEGSGAIIDISENAQEFKKITIPVYGADPSSGEKSDFSAPVAAYAVKSGNCAFVALAEKGDAVCSLTAAKALKKSSYNRVGASFDITKVKTIDEKVYASKVPYNEEIKISYRFLSGENATYAAMASACRENLIRNGTLSLQQSDKTKSYPFVLSLIGSAKEGKEKAKVRTFTTFEEAEEIISFFRSKGISDIALRYRGMFTGQLSQNDISKLKVFAKLGSKEELSSFKSFCNLQNIKIYPEVNLISAQKGKLEGAAESISRQKAELSQTKINTKLFYCNTVSNFSDLSDVKNQTNNLLAKFKDYSFEGICLSDVGNILYSSYSAKNPLNRQNTAEIVSSQVSSISPQKSIMLSGSNIYAVKYADFITDLPDTSKLAKRDYCTSVPFMQILLHGIVPYSSKSVNLCSDFEKEVLRAAEYGEILSCEFYYDNEKISDSEQTTSDNLSYMNFGVQAQTAYERLSRIYSELSSKKITNHYAVKKGVYCTQFGSDASVYVNYTSKDVKINGVTVEAKSFLKV